MAVETSLWPCLSGRRCGDTDDDDDVDGCVDRKDLMLIEEKTLLDRLCGMISEEEVEEDEDEGVEETSLCLLLLLLWSFFVYMEPLNSIGEWAGDCVGGNVTEGDGGSSSRKSKMLSQPSCHTSTLCLLA